MLDVVEELGDDASISLVRALVGLQRFTVEPDLQKGTGGGIRQHFSIGHRVNVCDNFPGTRFHKTSGRRFAGCILVFEGDGHGLTPVGGAGGTLGAPTIGQSVAGEVKRGPRMFT